LLSSLDVAGLEVHRHMERWVVRNALQKPDRIALMRGEPRRVGVSLRVADVPADVEDARRAVDVAEDGERIERWLARSLFVVAIPREWFVQDVDEVGSALEHLVVHGVGTGEL
jgi:hypothetical protein